MFNNSRHLTRIAKCSSTLICSRKYQVTVIGAAGGVGQPLSMLLKMNPLVSKLVMHDIQKQTAGVGLDLSHLPTDTAVEAFTGDGCLEKALTNANVVVVDAGLSDKVPPDEQFKKNSETVANLMLKIGKVCPCAFIAIVTNPVNNLVPLAAEALRKAGTYDQRKLFGVTNANLLRAQTFYAKEIGVSAACASVPVIGGNSLCTIVPLFSQASPPSTLKQEQLCGLVRKVRDATKSVIDGKGGEASATIAVAYATNGFVQGLLEAIAGSPNIQYAFVQNNDFGTCFFSGPLLIDCHGVYEMQMIGPLTKMECEMLEVAIDDIRKDVLKGQVRFSELFPRKKPC